MAPYLVIEVVGGPLDGLRACGEKDNLSIGRQVGNSLTLAIDQAVSGYHAEIVLEGNVWCLRDLGSTNGTWFKGNRVEPKTSIPLESGTQILVGTNSVLRVTLTDVVLPAIRFNSHQEDVRDLHSMESDFARFWDELYAEKPAFIDTAMLFNQLGQSQHIGVLAGFFQQKGLAESVESWIEQKRSANRVYRLDPELVAVAPRVLEIFGQVKKEASELSVRSFIDGILSERLERGLGNGDLDGWLENFKPGDLPAQQKTEPPPPPPSPKKKEAPPPPVKPPAKPVVEAVTPAKNDPQMALFLDFILQTEKIVLGFIKDAVHPTTVPDHFSLPGFASTAEEILEQPQAEKSAQFLKEYLPVLLSSLKVVLVAQREGASNYPAKLDEQLTDILEEINKGSMFDQFRQSSGLSPADRIRGVLKSAETSGLGEHLIRERIREKMKIIRLTREEKS